MCTGFWWGNVTEGDHWREPDVDGSIILRQIEGRDVHRVLLVKREGKRPLE
jgi:hypothetical protein